MRFFQELREILDKKKNNKHKTKRTLTTHGSQEGIVMWKLQSIFGIAHHEVGNYGSPIGKNKKARPSKPD